MSRGACTDVTWVNPSCPHFCNNVVTSNWVNVFACDAVNFVCGTGAGRGNCTASNFTILPQRIVLRDDQQPNSKNGVAYTNQSINLVQASSAANTASNTAPPLVQASSASSTAPPLAATTAGPTPTSPATTSHEPSPTIVGLGVGIPLGVLLLASLAVILLQWRNLRRLKQSQGGVPNAGSEDSDKEMVSVSRPYRRPIGELPSSFAGHEIEGTKPVQEQQSPISGPSSATTSTAHRSMVWNEASRVYTPAK